MAWILAKCLETIFLNPIKHYIILIICYNENVNIQSAYLNVKFVDKKEIK